MTIYKAPVEEISFLLNHVLDFERIARLPGYEEATPDTVEAILTEAARFFEEVVAPTNLTADQQGTRLEGDKVVTAPVLEGIYQQMVEAGWLGLAGDPEYGGQGLPRVISWAMQEMLQSANMAFSLCPILNLGVITALKRHGSDLLKDIYLPKLVSGEWAGTMNLTEPQAGSDLAAITTRAVPEGDHYRLTGQKIFITWGDQSFTENIVHLVLARLPDAPEGVKGISLFVVPKFLVNANGEIGERNDVYPVGVEHKLGIHASPTCTMSYGENGGAIGYLVGQEHQGLVYMFSMMNEARLSVGLQGVAIAERARQQAADYARTRVQGNVPGEAGRTTIIHHPDVRRMLLQIKSLTEAGRVLAYLAIIHEDISVKTSDEDEREFSKRRVDILTPLVKGWCTEMALEATSLGLQVHGGIGYIEETGAAQHLRDARILSIYEGTNGIQAMDLVGRKVLLDKGVMAKELLVDLQEVVKEIANAGEDMMPIAKALGDSLGSCREAVEYLFANARENWAVAGAAGFDLMMLMGTTVAGIMLGKAATVAAAQLARGDGNSDFNRTKLTTATFFVQHILPRTHAYLKSIEAGPEAILSLDDAGF